MEKFSDFAQEEIRFSEKCVSIDSVLGKELEIHEYTLSESNFKDSQGKTRMTLRVKIDGEFRVIFTKSEVLIRQMKQYESHLPFACTIIKPRRYYTFS